MAWETRQSEGTGQSAQPEQPAAQPAEEFDYRTSPVNPKGEELPAGAKSWTPTGQPYFGPGLGGTLKRYAWSMMGSPSGQDDGRWQRFLEMTDQPEFWSDPTSKEFQQGAKDFGAGVMGETATREQDWNQLKEGNARLKEIETQYGSDPANMPSEVAAEYKEIGEIWSDPGRALGKVESATSGSLLSPLIRGSKVAVQATLDLLSEAAIKVEQAQGVTSAMRDYAQENSGLPALASDIDRTDPGAPTSQEEAEFWSNPMAAIKSEGAQEMANIASRLVLPVLNSWDAFRFWSAPGTTKEKMKVLETGWDAGRILYSQAIKPSLLAEFKRRAAAGEDPQLLAMELQNPWAEAVGQAVLDPLNFIGAASKAYKAAGMLDDATDAVRGGSLGDEAVELLTDAGRGMPGALGETTAAQRMGKFDDILVKNVDRIEKQRLTVDFNNFSPTAKTLSSGGMAVRSGKTVATVSNVVLSAIMRNGGTADDTADFFHLLSKAASTNKNIRLEAWDQIMTMSNRFGLGRYAFSDDVLETGVLLRNLTEDKELLTAFRTAKGDLGKTAEILDKTFLRAVEKQTPSYKELKTIAEAFKTGKDTSARAEKLAKTFEGITPTARAFWEAHAGKVGDFRTAVNANLGKFFFSQPGFVSRNFSNNFMTMVVDQGFTGTVKSYFRDGKFYSIKSVEDDLMKWFGGKLPPATTGISLSKSEKAETFVSKLNDRVESGFAKRIYWKQFRDTMDKFMSPGVALPKREEFKALGMTDEGIEHFVHILKNEAAGSVEQAIVKYSEKFGENGLLDTWKRWNGSVSPEELKGLTETGLTNEIDEIVSSAKTPQEIKQRIRKLKQELVNRANSAADNPIGVNRERKGFEFMEGIGKATEEGLLDVDGTNKLNILIEQSEKASDELMRAIGKARDMTADPALREQFSVMESVFSAERRGTTRTTSKQLWDTAWDMKRKIKNATGLQVEQMWNRSILAKQGPAPAGITGQEFLDKLFPATRDQVSSTWETYFAEGFDRLTPLIDRLTEQFPEMEGIFSRAQKSSAELNMYRTATYKNGKIFYSQPPKNIFELAKRYGISTATGTPQEGRAIPNNKQLLATINKYAEKKYKTLEEVPLDEAERALQARGRGAQTTADAARVEAPRAAKAVQPELAASPVTMDEATQIPRGELPPEVSTRFEEEARRLLDELNSGTGPQVSRPRQGEGGAVTSIPSTNVDWYRELPKNLQNKKTLNAALEKIVKDKGSDKGVTVERLKELIIDRFRYGSDGAPPDLKVLKGLGADEKTLQSALDEYNDFTKQELTLEQVLDTPADEAAAVADEAAELAPDLENPYGYYDDEGNLVTPTDELGEIRAPSPNPEVQITPPYVDGSTPIPGQMWKENSNGILAALNKIETHMLDNYGMQAVEKLDNSTLKGLKRLMKDAGGRITEGIAIADKIGKEWRDFALLPYGETKNFDLAASYAFPYQFWYSRSYANWMQRVATDPQVIANYARIKETMNRVNKDSPEWWRYNVEIPSHFLGLPNEHPMSFNLEANIWPLYGLTGTDFSDPQRRQNWMTATVDDMGKMGPSVWSPVQWAIALAYKAQGEDELAQAWGGRIIPQTATFKAVSSYFGQPVELDPGVQLFSGEGIMDFAAMDKYERNRVGRAITAMVQSGEMTEEQAVEVARTQEGPAWDEAVRRSTKLRAFGQITSYMAGVGMKPRTEEDRITDEFYEKYYRLQNLNEADLISPEQYQQEWDGLRETYPFMDALLLSRKAGPDRDRAYAYNVLGRIPPGQASELYKLVGISPEVAQKFYDSKGDIKGWSESEREKFVAATVDLGAMLAIPDYATKSEYNEARNAYKAVQAGMKETFGPDIQEQIDHYYGLEDKNERQAFAKTHPQVTDALAWQNEQVVNNELLYTYYGGISSLEKYGKNKMYDQLYEKFGADIGEKFNQYYDMQISDPAGAKSFYRQHPELKAYSKEKTKLEQDVLRYVVEFGSKLPDTPELQLTGNEPGSVAQENIANYAAQSTPDFSYWQQELPEVSAILQDVWSSNEEIPYQIEKNLDYVAQNYGYRSGEDLMQAILISMQRQQ